MMSEKRKKYTPTEKAKIALEAIKSELTLAQISSKYGAHSTQFMRGRNRRSLWFCRKKIINRLEYDYLIAQS